MQNYFRFLWKKYLSIFFWIVELKQVFSKDLRQLSAACGQEYFKNLRVKHSGLWNTYCIGLDHPIRTRDSSFVLIRTSLDWMANQLNVLCGQHRSCQHPLLLHILRFITCFRKLVLEYIFMPYYLGPYIPTLTFKPHELFHYCGCTFDYLS